jgi:hypothetical protein
MYHCTGAANFDALTLEEVKDLSGGKTQKGK